MHDEITEKYWEVVIVQFVKLKVPHVVNPDPLGRCPCDVVIIDAALYTVSAGPQEGLTWSPDCNNCGAAVMGVRLEEGLFGSHY